MEKKIGEIREELKAAEDNLLPDFIEKYSLDERSGVQTLIAQAKKRIEKLEQEKARIEALRKYEKEYAGYISAGSMKSAEARLRDRSWRER